MKIELGMIVYHEDCYNGKEPLKVIGIRENEVELEGDYSGGTHNVCQRDWLPIKGIVEQSLQVKLKNLENSYIYNRKMEDLHSANRKIASDGLYRLVVNTIRDILGEEERKIVVEPNQVLVSSDGRDDCPVYLVTVGKNNIYFNDSKRENFFKLGELSSCFTVDSIIALIERLQSKVKG